MKAMAMSRASSSVTSLPSRAIATEALSSACWKSDFMRDALV